MNPETKNPEEMTNDELRQSIAAEAAALSAAPPEEKPAETEKPKTFEITIGGTTYAADSQDALNEKIKAALESTKTALKDRERQIHELKNKAPDPVKIEPKPEAFDQNKYIQLINENALKAAEYLEQHRPAATDETVQELKQAHEANKARAALEAEVMAFQTSDVGQEYVKVASKEFNDAMVAFMNEQQIPKTALGFETAFNRLKRAGKVPDLQTEQTGRRKPPPASSAGAGGTPQEEEPDFDRMTKEQLAAHLRKNGYEVSVN